MARWPNPLPPPGTVQPPSVEKRRGWGVFSDVFLPLLEGRRIQTAVLQDRERSKAAAIPSVCVPRTGPSSASVSPSEDVASPESRRV